MTILIIENFNLNILILSTETTAVIGHFLFYSSILRAKHLYRSLYIKRDMEISGFFFGDILERYGGVAIKLFLDNYQLLCSP